MSDAAAFDQDMIDSMVASAEEDTIESKVARLEAEVSEVKGAIKTLLIDIRETMNVLENPFQNIQGLANMAAEGALMPPASPATPQVEEEEAAEVEPAAIQIEEKLETQPKMDVPAGITDPLQQVPNIPNLELFDPMSFYKTIVWSKEMVSKYDYETIEELVDVFSLLGYFTDDIKQIILKIASILSKDNNLDSAVLDLYRLYTVLNPGDSSLDSKVLDFMLNECERGNSCQTK
ncbi:hypothetical protein J2755_000915 [Methanohalophilus levihalophilus]|uniref:hypothetical protein n=1 Tax=Methanohalophilus levihalophilus TaxID=1431282 RepID=UPI001AE2B7B2|nr:hypothetical protein [Methanohalophilus levihalophilus]MBP2029981.1 hypothetical protein [Methanohalophilus levihalophilus]